MENQEMATAGLDAPQLPITEFSTNTELENLVHMDTTAEVAGYIDEIIGARAVGNGRFRLLKFVINNASGRRIFALIWGTLIEEYETKVAINRVVRLRGVLVKRSAPNYFQEEQQFVAFEVNVQAYTEVQFFQIYGAGNIPIAPPVQEVTFDTISHFPGQVIRITGFLKLRFRMVVTAGQGLRTGFCTLTDGHFRLPVVVSSWTVANQELSVAIAEGESLTMVGTVHVDNHQIVKLIVQSFSAIDRNEDTEPLSKAQLRAGSVVIRHEEA